MAATWYQEDVADEFDPEADELEAIDSTQPGGGDHSSAGSQEAVRVVLIDFSKVRAAERYYLGFSYADTAAPWFLHREPPAAHPRKPALRAHSFSSVGLAPKSNPDNLTGATYRDGEFPGPAGETMRYADYQKAVCTVRYKAWGRVRFLGDADVGDEFDPSQEYKRWTRWTAQPNVQQLSADGTSQLVFREGAGGNEAPTADSTPFPAPVAELMVKTVLQADWLFVPWEYVSSQDHVLKPDRFLRVLGTVNDGPVAGYAKGTLLLSAIKTEDVLFPVMSEDPYNWPLAGLHISVIWEHFDPQNKGVSGSEYRGHRLFPFRGGSWWYATRELTGKELIPLTDHLSIWKHVGDPS